MIGLRESNQSIIEQIEDELPRSTAYWLLITIVLAQAWSIYLACYHSRVLGLILTLIVNKFVKYGHIKFGSFSFSVLSGKVMIRDIHLVTEDYSVRAHYGWIIFRWWRPYVYKDLSEDFSHSETRMSIFLESFELHIYNRSETYAKLEKLFGIPVEMVPKQEEQDDIVQKKIKQAENGMHWRDLIPVTKVEINTGRVVCGNHLLPHTLKISFDEAHLLYTTKPASTSFDKFMHVAKCRCENMRIMMVKSPKYHGPVDEPPRYMGEGFVVLQSNEVDIYYYMDEPGLVPHEPELMELADGEVIVKRTYPCFGLDIKCGKNTDFNYGPWVDRQRDHLWQFFYPQDYQPLVPTQEAQPGELRQYRTFEIKLTVNAAATIDILFTKNSVTQAIHMNAEQGTYVEAIIPWVVEEVGYTSKVKGQLMLLDASTSMTFRSLMQCETLEFEVTANYPITWNEHQEWRCDFTACKASLYLIFEHKNFFSDLMDDWSTKTPPDIYSFMPFTWTINFIIKQFELLALTNEYNWIDTSSHLPENAHIAFCGELFDMSLQLPYIDFLPPSMPILLVIKAETVDCRLYLPENNTSRQTLLALARNKKIVDREGNDLDRPFAYYRRKPTWKNSLCQGEDWVDAWTTNNVLVTMRFTYHPSPIIMGTSPDLDLMGVISPDVEESLLQPLRPLPPDSPRHPPRSPVDFDASLWEPDKLCLELEVGPSVICLYGTLLSNLLNLKENYVGEDQRVSDYEESPSSGDDHDSSFVHVNSPDEDSQKDFDPRQYRPFTVTVAVTLHDIQAHLVKHCGPEDTTCPYAYVERLCFEMDKQYLETKLQLLLSPAVLIIRDNHQRDQESDHLKEGHLALSGLQVRGHAMFSHEGLPLDSETLEYAWMVEAIIGEISGKLTSPQLQNVAEFLQTFIMLIEDPENKLQRPLPYELCQHMLPQPQCRMLPQCPFPCPTSDSIKYRMTRLSLDSVNLFLVEAGSALNVQVFPIRLSTCNLHGEDTRAGITGILEQISLKQYMSCAQLQVEQGTPELWLEAGGFKLGPINVEAAMALPCRDLHTVQDVYLHLHDKKTKRLWFLWPGDSALPLHAHSHSLLSKCGCQGGCRFFGNNRNGLSFFKPRKQRESSRAAVPQVFPEGIDPGFGQSLLHKERLVFEMGRVGGVEPKEKTSPSEFTFTRGYMSTLTSPESPGEKPGFNEEGPLRMSSSSSTGVVKQVPASSTNRPQSDPTTKPATAPARRSPVPGCEAPTPGSDRTSGSIPSSPSLEAAKRRSVTGSLAGHSRTAPGMAHRKGSVHCSSLSLESERYFSAEEEVISSSSSIISQPRNDGTLRASESHLDLLGDTSSASASTTLTREQVLKGMENGGPGSVSSVSSSSSSTLSYASAASDKGSDTFSDTAREEFSLVDLHNQINQPITKSPLLLSCYASHLTQYNCQDWSAAPVSACFYMGTKGMRSIHSEYSLSSASQSIYGGGAAWVPHFHKVRDGFSMAQMKEREEHQLPSPPGRKESTEFNFSAVPEEEEEPWERGELQNTSKTTAMVKVTGNFDILVTPLLLESLQKYIEAVTPTLARLHPSALIDGIHSKCLERLKQQNKLKEEQGWEDDSPVRPFSRQPTLDGEKRMKTEVMKTTSLQAFFSLPKINVCLLQASLVEEVIAFSVLENIHDLTAVSLLTICVEGIRCQLLSNQHSCRQSIEAEGISSPRPGMATSQPKSRTNSVSGESDKEVPLETNREENVGTLELHHVHCQLRRLLRYSNFSDNIVLTAIPEYRSAVLFLFRSDPVASATPLSTPASGASLSAGTPISMTNQAPHSGSPRRRLSRTFSLDQEREEIQGHAHGVILMECGLEEVRVTAVQRLGYQEGSDAQLQQQMENVVKTLLDMQESMREEIEQQTEGSTSPTDEPIPMSSPSAQRSSESLASSWNSRVSVASESTFRPECAPPVPLQGDASNGRLDLKTIWFHFAAPPPISIKKKMDYTRLDWNLLSTATPAINAWMNPCYRAAFAVRKLVGTLTLRTSSIIACIMTEALDVPGIHIPYKQSKFSKSTPLSRTLQEEPSCQLLTVLRKYIQRYGTEATEHAVNSETLPQLITLQKGVLALTRQWKNNLYMPNLSHMNFGPKKVRPYNVTFSLPMEGSQNLSDDDAFLDQYDVVDEKTSLLQAEGGSVHLSASISSVDKVGQVGPGDRTADGVSNPSTASGFKPRRFFGQVHLRGKHPFCSCTGQHATSGDTPDHKQPTVSSPVVMVPSATIPHNDSFASMGSSSSLDQNVTATPSHTPQKPKQQSILKNRLSHNEDLYQWMAKQQEGLGPPGEEETKFSEGGSRGEGWGFGSAWSQDDSRTDITEGASCTMATSIMQLADAQLLFKPLLQSLGLHVEGVRPSAMMKKFGGHLLLQGGMETLKVIIIESETSQSRARGKGGKGKSSLRHHNKLRLSPSTPAFVCEGFHLNVSMKDVVDFEQRDAGLTSSGRKTFQFAMHKLEAKPTTLQVNFLINCDAIMQNIDMALLRLAHQVITMVDNIQETRGELKQRRSSVDWVKGHRKQGSKDSTSSTDTQQSDTSQSDLPLRSPMASRRLGKDAPLASDKFIANIRNPPPPGSSLAESRRPDLLPLAAVTKRPQLRFAREPKKEKSVSSSTPGQASELATPVQSLNLSDSVTIEMMDTSSPALAEKTIVDEIRETTPQCWRHLYHLLELYSTIAEPKTVLRRPGLQKLPVIEEEPEKDGSRASSDTSHQVHTASAPREHKPRSKVDMVAMEEQQIGNQPLAQTSLIRTRFKQSIYIGESIPLVVYGIAKVQRVQMLAVLSGLKLEAELRKVHASGTYKEKVKGFLHRKSSESSFTAHVGNSMIVLLEGILPNMQTVVTVNVGKSQALYTSLMRRSKEHNSALTSIGLIDINIPQHPVVLHGMMTRSSRHITSTLQEFRWPTRPGKGSEPSESQSGEVLQETVEEKAATKKGKVEEAERSRTLTYSIHLKAVLQGLVTRASILPSLKAQHKTGVITVSGMTGRKARFTALLPKHTLSFKSKVQTTETSIPSQASVELPRIHVYADYRHHVVGGECSEEVRGEGLVLREGNYLNAHAEVGMLDLSLTTDLLNHLVFVQKVFMKEVNEVVQKVSGSDQPERLWTETSKTSTSHSSDPLLYSFAIRLKGIQITATTPSSSAVRLETGEIELELSNRVQTAQPPSAETHGCIEGSSEVLLTVGYSLFSAVNQNQKMFVRAQIDLNVALGQLLKNPVFEEADPEFQTMAFFKTKIGIRNALQDEMIPWVSTDQEALLISLTRPIVLAQPLAFDKAVFVWLNYKNAYEYWTEQRMALNNEVLMATRQVMDKLPFLAQTSAQSFSTLFLQLTVTDLGICIPLSPLPYQSTQPGGVMESEPGAAFVLTIENTEISACSSGSLVSKGKFNGFCLRFADDFETSWDDWKPSQAESPVMNNCTVPAGTYEVCSRTINQLSADRCKSAKWVMSVLWQMQGIDVHLDTNIGKRLSALGKTLTAIAGDSDEDEEEDESEDALEDEDQEEASDTELESSSRRQSLVADLLPDVSHDLAPKDRVRHIQWEMDEQARVVQDLKQLGASTSTIEMEKKKLQELQALLFQDFRKEVINKLKRQGERATAIRDKLGLGSKISHVRSVSYGGRKRDSSQVDASRTTSYTLDYRSLRRDSPSSRSSAFKTEHGAPPLLPPQESDSSVKQTDSKDDVPPMSSTSLPYVLDSSSSSDSDAFAQPGVELRRPRKKRSIQMQQSSSSITAGSSANTSSQKSMTEPNVDFELDVKVFIDSGQCVLYPKEAVDEELKKKEKRERTATTEFSSNLHSPQTRRKLKHQESLPMLYPGKRSGLPQMLPQVETTIFCLPSVDVKMHYNSRVTPDQGGMVESCSRFPQPPPGPCPSPTTRFPDPYLLENTATYSEPDAASTPNFLPGDSASNENNSSNAAAPRRLHVKKANLYAWLSLQSLPEEMIISPSLLDFLEQALEPIPMSFHTSKKDEQNPYDSDDDYDDDNIDDDDDDENVEVMGSMLNLDLDASQGSFSSPSASFPVDVVVFIKVEPSVIRFNCQPISRVECLLQVPLLELVFSTKKGDTEGFAYDNPPPPTKKGTSRSMSSNSTGRERHFSAGLSSAGLSGAGSSRTRLASAVSESVPQAGGLSVTGCLSNFSLYVFHPYGTTQRRLGSIQENAGSSFLDMSRKDSLSLRVEFVRVNISRSRKIDMRLGDLTSAKSEAQTKSNVVRFSCICDIGTASFKYDMRRLSEILSLPKAWYRRNLARRLFLGDDSFQQLADDELDGSSSSSAGDQVHTLHSPTSASSPTLNIVEPHWFSHHRRASSGDKIKVQVSPELKSEIADSAKKKGVSMPQSPTDPPGTREKRKSKQYVSPELSGRGAHHSNQTPRVATTWETLVLFAINLARLEVEVNMSNVMGNTTWSTREIKSQGRLSIDSSGHKNMHITAGLSGSSFESRGGVVGGAIDLQGLSAFFKVSEDPELGQDPDHQAGLSLYALEGRSDYMGSSVLMVRLSDLNLVLRDEWHVETSTIKDTPLATKRAAYLFVNGSLSWDQLHLLISRSTTPDLVKLASKLEEFFSQQLTSSKRVFSAFNPIRHRPSQSHHKVEDLTSELRHHRHWQPALKSLQESTFSMLPRLLPREGTILGGTVTLEGQNLSLASFHGINFRSKSWAIFSIKEPYIYFATEAQNTPENYTHIVEDLTFMVGHKSSQSSSGQHVDMDAMSGQHMATICKVSRGHCVPQQFTSVREWFCYAFSSTETSHLLNFPDILRESGESPQEHRKRKVDKTYTHETEIIFALPSLYMNLKTFHLQGEKEPEPSDEKPVVECSFVTEFYDHIQVAMDAEVILFLHDLVSSYIKEKDKGTKASLYHAAKMAKSPDADKRRITDPTLALKQDWRDFKCKAWQLEPTVRLYHWASRQIDPVGVDYVLQKLGFSHARVTIPKWMQRGVMDPMDKILSVLVNKVIVALQDSPDKDMETD